MSINVQKFELGTTVVIKTKRDSALVKVWLTSGRRPSSLWQSSYTVCASRTYSCTVPTSSVHDKNLVIKTR